MRRLAPLLALLALLGGCGELSRPFAGNPGANGRVLLQPPPPLLAVPAPEHAFLGPEAARSLARDLVGFLVEREVPAVAAPAHPGDWRLEIAGHPREGGLVLSYTVFDPLGRERGTAETPPVPLASWGAAPAEATLRAAAQAATPGVAQLLSSIEADRKRSDPNSLLNRPARVFVPAVTGAPGDGDTSLATQMRRELGKLGMTVQETAKDSDFTIAGHVAVTPTAGRQERVEITWVVTDASGRERGKVAQLNEIPAGTLNGLWVDVAVVVAQEAAPGVRDVMTK